MELIKAYLQVTDKHYEEKLSLIKYIENAIDNEELDASEIKKTIIAMRTRREFTKDYRTRAVERDIQLRLSQKFKNELFERTYLGDFSMEQQTLDLERGMKSVFKFGLGASI